MTTFFWVALSANAITTIVSLAALLIVVWLGPGRWTNLSFALLLSAIVLWMSSSALARLLVNVPQLGGNQQLVLNVVALGFALVGITLFWFVESFAPLERRWYRVANVVGAVVYTLFIVLLVRNGIVTDARRGSDGGLLFTITPIGTVLSAFHYVYDALALYVLIRRHAWRDHRYLTIGALIVIATSVIALIFPAISIQTFMIPVGAVFMTYEVVRQQLFNPLLELNRHLEAEVASRSAELAVSLAEQERVRSELTVARDIQLSLLPLVTPQPPHLLVAGRSVPAQEVGGDFFTYHSFADGRLGVAVGDVSGKGIPAALLMAFSLRTFELLVDQHADQGALLTACNAALAPRLMQSNMNTGFLSMVIDRSVRSASIANAGMITPLLWRGGAVRHIDSHGLPLGSLADATYAQQALALHAGDMLLLVSDGIVEAMNPSGEMWGFARLEAVFSAVGDCTPADVVDAILSEVHQFAADAPPHDDMTVVALQLTDHA